tara:strand:- start:418 stop:1578 length:1161 start_codon:yes stop_codon:yes gene_type:complete
MSLYLETDAGIFAVQSKKPNRLFRMEKKNHEIEWAKVVSKMFMLVAWLIVGIIILSGLLLNYPYALLTVDKVELAPEQSEAQAAQPQKIETDYFSADFGVSKLGNSMYEESVKYGFALVSETYKYIGPENGDPKMVYTGNNLACKNCHLNSGTKKHSAPYIGVTTRYPNYRGRENKIGSIEERVNGCMERSMNGKKLPTDSKEMRAIVSYMTWLGRNVPSGEKFDGVGFTKVNLPDRAVDLAHGAQVYTEKCVSCHGAEGAGLKNGNGLGYTYPPLWGKDTYNHGAGMNRVITAAQFIKGNMPFGATSENPMLTDEEAYDVAGYIDSKDRPIKSNTDTDYPDLKRKPVSTPYGPWDDEFSAEQHKFGPFKPIMEHYQNQYGIKKTK